MMPRSATRTRLMGQRSEPVSEGDRVRRKFRPQLTYANVMSTLAVFIALGGSSYAAVTLNGANIKHRSIPAAKLKRNTVTGLEVRESRLGRVPRAVLADRLSETGAAALKTRCPGDTFPIAGTCVEREARSPAAYGSAVNACLNVDLPNGRGRRLPTHGELMAALTAVPLAANGELTAAVVPSTQHPGEVDALYMTDTGGRVAITPDRFEGAKAFRCVTDPIN
jgi:hypothetical protein